MIKFLLATMMMMETMTTMATNGKKVGNDDFLRYYYCISQIEVVQDFFFLKDNLDLKRNKLNT